MFYLNKIIYPKFRGIFDLKNFTMRFLRLYNLVEVVRVSIMIDKPLLSYHFSLVIQTGIIRLIDYLFFYMQQFFSISFRFMLKVAKGALALRFKIELDFFQFLCYLIHVDTKYSGFPIMFNCNVHVLIPSPRMLIFKHYPSSRIMCCVCVE